MYCIKVIIVLFYDDYYINIFLKIKQNFNSIQLNNKTKEKKLKKKLNINANRHRKLL
jgi:hypothetical protein